MKQVGNLAIVGAQRKDVLLTLFNGNITVTAGDTWNPSTRCARWDDDKTISEIIHELNFGDMSKKEGMK